MPELTPLRFDSILRRYIWGGRRLGEVFGKPIGPENDYAESWELVDRGPDQSRVLYGPHAGLTLAEILSRHGGELLGTDARYDRFPLLVKLLDAQKLLSVQVHPDDAGGAKLSPPDLGKTKVWCVLDAVPGSKMYVGLKPGVDRGALERELASGTCENCLHEIEPEIGDVVFLPPGTLHALGAGLLIAEFQQSSDATLRLFDWNRVGADGKPRQLHIEAALDTIDYARGPIEPIRRPLRKSVTENSISITELASCDKFVLERLQAAGTSTYRSGSRCRIWMVVAGRLTIAEDPSGKPLLPGQMVLLPASLSQASINAAPGTVVYDCRLPA